jgi:signal transduction histidine kinase
MPPPPAREDEGSRPQPGLALLGLLAGVALLAQLGATLARNGPLAPLLPAVLLVVLGVAGYRELRQRCARLERIRAAEQAAAAAALDAAEARLVQQEKLAQLGELMAGVAHEINNSVSFIVGNVEPMREKLDTLRLLAALPSCDPRLAPLAERIARSFDIVARGAERTAGIVSDLRAFARGAVAVGPVDVRDSIEVTLRLLQPRWAHRIAVHCEFGEVPAVAGVRGQLDQLFMNLLANACDAIEDDGRVWIRLAADAESATVTIEDDGSGIAAGARPRLFEPFFTTKPGDKGTGLGLAISRRIVIEHGGSIEAADRPGGGARFTVVLPLHRDAGVSPRHDVVLPAEAPRA